MQIVWAGSDPNSLILAAKVTMNYQDKGLVNQTMIVDKNKTYIFDIDSLDYSFECREERLYFINYRIKNSVSLLTYDRSSHAINVFPLSLNYNSSRGMLSYNDNKMALAIMTNHFTIFWEAKLTKDISWKWGYELLYSNVHSLKLNNDIVFVSTTKDQSPL